MYKFFFAILCTLTVILPNIFCNAKPRNNVCRTFDGYQNILWSDDCFYSPDQNLNVTQIIQRYIGVYESHSVQTEDGYILAVFRIPRKNPKGVILLQHPLGADSTVWVSQYNESAAFLLWNAGYDVWLPNNRGTPYSQKNIYYSVDDEKFWDFSFHEMGLYDHKAVIDYILKETGHEKIIFWGHSLSATTSLVYATVRAEEAAQKLKIIIGMCPVTYLRNTKVLVRHLAPFWRIIQFFNQLIRSYQGFNHNNPFIRIMVATSLFFPFKQPIVWLLYEFSGGGSIDEYDPICFNEMFTQCFQSVSWKVFYHFAQIINSGYFQLYDYGERRNLLMYGQNKPPVYSLEDVKVPYLLMHGKQDILSTTEDNDLMWSKLSPEAKIYGRWIQEPLGHIEYHFGKDRIELVYKRALRFLDQL